MCSIRFISSHQYKGDQQIVMVAFGVWPGGCLHGSFRAFCAQFRPQNRDNSIEEAELNRISLLTLQEDR